MAMGRPSMSEKTQIWMEIRKAVPSMNQHGVNTVEVGQRRLMDHQVLNQTRCSRGCSLNSVVIT